MLICGWQTCHQPKDNCWYNMVARGFAALHAERAPFAAWPGDALRVTSPQLVDAKSPPAASLHTTSPPLPEWIGSAPDWRPVPPPPEPPRPVPLAPSRPDGVELGTVPAAVSPLTDREVVGNRFRHGQLIHALLQHLPLVGETERREAALRYLRRPGYGLPDGEADRVATEVLAVMSHPDMVPLFGPAGRAEVPLTGVIGDTVIGGLVDRLAVLPDRVLVADFKTNRRPPVGLADTPVMYLRQMASYRAVLRSVFPDRPVCCALIWTRQARVVLLPDDLLDRHAPGHSSVET